MCATQQWNLPGRRHRSGTKAVHGTLWKQQRCCTSSSALYTHCETKRAREGRVPQRSAELSVRLVHWHKLRQRSLAVYSVQPVVSPSDVEREVVHPCPSFSRATLMFAGIVSIFSACVGSSTEGLIGLQIDTS